MYDYLFYNSKDSVLFATVDDASLLNKMVFSYLSQYFPDDTYFYHEGRSDAGIYIQW